MESSTNYANLEALLNIIANGMEILCIASGGPLLFLWWVPHANGTTGYRLKLFLTGLGLVIYGLATPGIINLLISSGDAGMLIGLILGVVLAVIALVTMLAVYFLPTYFAFHVQKKEKKVAILALNVAGFLPLFWLVAFIWSTMPDRPQPTSGPPERVEE